MEVQEARERKRDRRKRWRKERSDVEEEERIYSSVA